MSPRRLALRTLMLGRGRAVLAIALIAACLCVLNLFAGSIGGAPTLTLWCVAGTVFGVIGSIVAATISMNAFERRREVATLRALGMRGRAVMAMYLAEAGLMVVAAAMIGVVGSGSGAWIINRACMAQPQAPMAIELEAAPMLLAAAAAMAVAMVAALAPALKAARADVAKGLAG